MTNNTSDIFNQHLRKAIEDLKDSVAPVSSEDWCPAGPSLIPLEAYTTISRNLDIALELQKAGDIENALAKLVRAARRVGFEEGLQEASFKVSEPEILRQANARHGGIGGSRKGVMYKERRERVVKQILEKEFRNPWRNLVDLVDEIRRLTDEAFENIKYSDRQIEMITRHPGIRRISNALMRATRRSR